MESTPPTDQYDNKLVARTSFETRRIDELKLTEQTREAAELASQAMREAFKQ